MTYAQILKNGENELRPITEDYIFDAFCLFSYVFKISKSKYFVEKNSEADSILTEKYFELINERKNFRPLQYIIGKWYFLDYEFYVGEGVLIPRSDTECLVLNAFEYIKKHNVKTVYDLCAGSGCIGISIAKKFDDVQVFCIEKSVSALSFLKKNIVLNNVKNVHAVSGDIFEGYEVFNAEDCEMIVSNPPYIKTEEISNLQKEVRLEPLEALDGGVDGLDFYYAIKEKWFDKIEKCRYIALECGEKQADEIANIFCGYPKKTFIYDLNNVKRDVCIYKDR